MCIRDRDKTGKEYNTKSMILVVTAFSDYQIYFRKEYAQSYNMTKIPYFDLTQDCTPFISFTFLQQHF